jgi:hypothetical protein
MADFRALCAELLADYDNCHYRSELSDRARTALAQPEPVAPTDEELLASVRHFYGDQAAADMGAEDDLRTARAVLARWGRPAIEPVPQQEDVHYAWELHDAEGEWQAGGSANSLDDVQREGNRYRQTYSQDGPHKLIIQQHRVTTIEPVPGVEGADA